MLSPSLRICVNDNTVVFVCVSNDEKLPTFDDSDGVNAASRPADCSLARDEDRTDRLLRDPTHARTNDTSSSSTRNYHHISILPASTLNSVSAIMQLTSTDARYLNNIYEQCEHKMVALIFAIVKSSAYRTTKH